MTQKTKIMIVCDSIDKERDEYIEWRSVLEEYLGKKSKCSTTYNRRILTSYVIIDFVSNKSTNTNGYKFIFISNEDNERILRLAIGEE